MSILLTGIVIRNERRIRLVFSNTLDVGAFTSLSYYTVEALDASGISPDVAAALVVPGASTNVELALSEDLVQGGRYQVSAIGVPATDLSVTNSQAVEPFTYAVTPNTKINVEPDVNDTDLLLYSRDIVWNGLDFVEDATGDLAAVEGVDNAQAAITRRLLSDGLPWDATYGAKPRQYVDGAAGAASTLRGELERQTLLDDRTKSVKATLQFDDALPTSAFFDVQIKLKGNRGKQSISVAVPLE